ncbi:hypothetical protein [Patulibacter americanus]|uniref:hypothetical protein n=1 Tax=Patulibacter americanus TaxID=588672 RepID=UPI000416EC43|nr:hypothetical protein [Patulibacter americanus]
MRRLFTTLVASAALAVAAGGGVAGAAEWDEVRLPAPAGGTLSVPAGFVGDLSFWAPNRGLMTVAGNNSVPAGLYSWDGESWHQLSTVCGGGQNSRIAWAGPTEFWTITVPSAGSAASGTGLCHFKDGAVVGSYSFYNVPAFGPSVPVNAATCRSANDCWFGGVGSLGADGTQPGAFHLHWDGTELRPVVNGQGRGVSDLITHGGAVLESTFAGIGAGVGAQPPFLRSPEDVPALLHRIDGFSFVNDPFVPTPVEGVPADGTDLRSMDTDGRTAWAVGGGAGSGPAAANGVVQRTPVAVRKDGDGPWQEVPLSGTLPTDRWFGSVAAVPGAGEAWATLTDSEVGGGFISGDSSAPSVAHIAADGAVRTVELDRRTGPAARGAATAVACTANDCWAATAKGYLYRRSTGATSARDTDPAFQGTISIRPNEAAAQAIADDPPADDSRLLAPPVELPTEADAEAAIECAAPPALVTRVKATTGKLTKLQRRQANAKVTLIIRFRLARRARVGVTFKRGKRTVARVKPRALKAGTRKLTVSVRRKSFPKNIKFSLKELTTPECTAGSGDVAGTGPAS